MDVRIERNEMVAKFREKAAAQNRCFICYPFKGTDGQLQFTSAGRVCVRPDGRVLRMAEDVAIPEGEGAVVGMAPNNKTPGRVVLLVRIRASQTVVRTTALAVK